MTPDKKWESYRRRARRIGIALAVAVFVAVMGLAALVAWALGRWMAGGETVKKSGRQMSKIHKIRHYSTPEAGFITGETICGRLWIDKDSRYKWANVTCKQCLKHKRKKQKAAKAGKEQ